MHLANPHSHYRRDAEFYDYFEAGTSMDRDSAVRIQNGVSHAADFTGSGIVLDIGSGNGWLGEKLDERNWSVVSVDLSLKNLHTIRRSGRPSSWQVLADAAHLPFKRGVFTRIIASETLEHLNDPMRTVSEILEALSGSGKLVVSTPYREIIPTYLCIHCNRPTPANAHIHSFDEHKLRSMLESREFKNVQVRYLLNRIFMRSRLSWAFRFLPYFLWRLVDKMCNFVFRNPTTIIVTGTID